MASSDSDRWGPCPTGELEQLQARLKGRKRNRRAVQVGATVAVLFVVSGTTIALLPPAANPLTISGITCNEAMGYMADFDQDELSQEKRAQVLKHLDHCPHCAEQYRKKGLVIHVLEHAADSLLAAASLPFQ